MFEPVVSGKHRHRLVSFRGATKEPPIVFLLGATKEPPIAFAFPVFLGATKEPPIAFAFPVFRCDEGAAYCIRFSRFY